VRDPADSERARAYYAKILPFYEKETAGQDTAFWRGLARSWRPARILEIGSGLGSIAAALSREAPAFGIDVSLAMLLRASRRRSRARFVAADMRDAVFGCRFDLIVAPSDPLCHLTRLEDRRRALTRVAGSLTPGGRFVLEALYRPGRRTLLFDRLVRRPGGVLEIAETWRPAGRRGLWSATYRYRDRVRGHPVQTLEASFTARSWSLAEIRRLFAECGLSVEEIWGDFRRRPFRRGGRRMVVVARRARFLH
jgi:SAM-dependent methyltransferase